MNNKGFTLIEILAVVIILSLLTLLVLPNITNSVRNFGSKTDELTLDMIEKATSLYVEDNSSKFKKTDGYSYCITIKELVEKEYLKEHIKYKGEDITNKKSLQVTYKDGFNYQLKDRVCDQLPKEYREVEYIEATETQYINTNFYPDSNSFIEMDVLVKNCEANKNNFIFGVNSGDDSIKKIALNLFYSSSRQVLEVYPRYSINSPSVASEVIEFERWYNYRLDKGDFYLDNVLIASYSETFEKSDYPLYINAYNNIGEVKNTQIGNIKIKTCKIWDNDVLVRHFLPCYRKSDNVIGMYDLVNDKFYTNSGTGDFEKGEDV